MSKIDWKAKLSSRKFWAAVVSYITAIATSFGVTDSWIARIVLIVTGIGALCVYMLAEGLADKSGAASGTIEQTVKSETAVEYDSSERLRKMTTISEYE